MSKGKKPYGEMRELILSAAYDLVKEGGIEALSARKLAYGIGYTVGTLYNIFTNMDEIILYLKNRVLNNFIDELTVKLEKIDGSAMNVLLAMAHHYVSFSESDYQLWHVLFIDKTNSSKDDLPKWYLLKVNKLHKMIAEQIALLNIQNVNIELETCIYWASIHGVASLNRSGKLDIISPEQVSIILENAVNRVFAAAKYNQG